MKQGALSISSVLEQAAVADAQKAVEAAEAAQEAEDKSNVLDSAAEDKQKETLDEEDKLEQFRLDKEARKAELKELQEDADGFKQEADDLVVAAARLLI